MLRALLELSRVSNLPTVWTNVIAAWVIANGRWQWDSKLAWLLVGASLVYSAGMILNDVFDAAWDRDHRPERPIPSGRMSFSMAMSIGVAWLLGGAAIMVMLGGAKWSYTLALVIAILAYDLYHKPWSGSVIVMGACRTLLYCVAASAVVMNDDSKAEPLIHFLRQSDVLFLGVVLGIYVIALTLTARAESSRNDTGGISWVHVGMLCLPLLNAAGSPPLEAVMSRLVVAPAFIIPIAYALRLMKRGGPAIGQAVGWLLAAIPAVDALAIAGRSLPLALCFVALVPLLRLWQRFIAAT